jgi:hypothetical protein
MYVLAAIFFAIGYPSVCLASALAIVAACAQRLMVVCVPELSAQAHRINVIHYSGSVVALSADRVELKEAVAVLAPAVCVIAMLDNTSLMHLLALAWLRHPGHRG